MLFVLFSLHRYPTDGFQHFSGGDSFASRPVPYQSRHLRVRELLGCFRFSEHLGYQGESHPDFFKKLKRESSPPDFFESQTCFFSCPHTCMTHSQRLIGTLGVFELRKAFEVQVTQKNLLILVCTEHETPNIIFEDMNVRGWVKCA
mgnify:CR=1 FL=1